MDKLAVIQSEETIKELNLIDDKIKGLVGTFKELVETGNKINSGLLKGTPKEFIQAEKELIALQKQKVQIMNQLAAAEKQLATINITNERTRKETANADKAELLLQQKKLQMSAQEEKAANKLISAYDLLNKKHIEARKAAMDLGVQHGITSSQFLEAAKVANQYDAKLKQVDATLGKHNRNVGNYNNLQVQLSQVMREAPNFAIDPRIGIMSLTNNLPMLGDAIGDVVRKNKELKTEFIASAAAARENAIANALATGQTQKSADALGKQAAAQVMSNYHATKAPGLWKQIAGALFSWQTLLVVGIGLVMMYNKEIIAWFGNLGKGKKAMDGLKEATKDLTAAKNEARKTAVKELVESEMLYRIMKDETVARKDRLSAAKDMQDLYPKIFGSMTTEQMMLGDTTKQYNELKSAIMAAAIAEGIRSKVAQKTQEFLDKEQANLDKVGQAKIGLAKAKNTGDTVISGQGETADVYVSGEYRVKRAELALDKARSVRKADQDSYKAYLDKMYNIGKSYQIEAEKLEKDDKEKEPKKDKVAPSISKEERDAIDLAIADRDNQIAKIKEQKLKMEITEKEYWERYITIQKNYRAKILQIINDDNARKKRISAQTRLKAITEIEKANKEIYDYEKAGMDAQRKLQEQNLENRMSAIKNDEYIMEVERIKQQNDVYNEMIANTDLFYQNLIEKAKKYGQEIINIEAERDTKIAGIQKEQMALNAKAPAAVKTDAEYYRQIEDSYRSAAHAEERRAIIANSRMNQREKDSFLSIKEKEQSLESLQIDKDRIQSEADLIRLKEQKEKLTLKEQEDLALITEKVSELNEKLAETEEAIRQIRMDKLREDWAGTLDFIAGGLSDLGFNNLAAQVNKTFDEIIGKTFDWKDATILAAAAVTDALTMLNQKTLDNRIAALDEQLLKTQESTEQELEFIDGRLARLNALDELSKEQIEERNALEDEARVIKEQQFQREKMIEAQKARAIQKAQSQQALISGIQGAVMAYMSQLMPGDPTSPIRGAIAAAATMAFAGLNAALIMSKNPVPQYFVGRKGGPEEIAWTQERGRELITNNGKIKSLGTDSGPILTKLDAGDTVHTASETEKLLASFDNMPKLGDHVFRKIARQNLSPVFIQKENIDYSKLASEVGKEFQRGLKKYDKTTYFEDENGNVFSQDGGNIPVYRGKKKKPTIIINTPRNERN